MIGAVGKSKALVWAIAALFVVILLIIIILVARSSGKNKAKADYAEKEAAKQKNPPAELPNNGQGIPEGWNPDQQVIKLYGAMAGAGTDEDMIWAALDNMTNDQLVAIYNAFGVYVIEQGYTDEDEDSLHDWFLGDLSGEDLTKATGYFSGLNLF